MTWLYQLSLWSTNVTDEEIGQLEQLQQLENLNVGGTRVTDAGIAQLAKLKAMTTLNAFGSRVSSEAIEQLKAQLPHLDVIEPEREPQTQADTRSL